MSALRNQLIPVHDPAAGLRMTEIFYSLQGEAASSGWPTVFVRLTGCPLRCSYCDTTYSFEGGERMALAHIIEQVQQYPAQHVCITGGEPLAQPNALLLMTQLCDLGYAVSLETSGALDVAAVDPRVSKVMDLKTPSSGEVARNLLSNLQHLHAHDQIKFVIANREDYDWSKQQLQQHDLSLKVDHVWFSPVFSTSAAQVGMPPFARELAEWILQDGLPVRLQLQLHKLLWQDAAGH